MASAQTYGDVVGRVRAVVGRQVGLDGARVDVAGTTLWTITDYKGRFRIHAVPVGHQTLNVQATGFASASQSMVPIYAGTETNQDFFLAHEGSGEAPMIPAPVIDPGGRGAHERVDATDLKLRPFTDQEDVATRWNSAPGVSYVAGRSGAQLVMVDGISLRAPYDGSTALLGLRLPLSMLQDASITMDPEAGAPGLAGVQRLVTVDGGDHWDVRGAYRTDRPVSGDADLGFDQVLVHASGPAGSARFVAALDAAGRLRSDAFTAPRGDERAPAPWELGHNAGERIDAAAKIRMPLGSTEAMQLLAVRSLDQRSVFDPVLKYDPGPGAGRRIDATLIAGELRRVVSSWSAFIRVHYFERGFTQSDLADPVSPSFGGLGGTYRFKGLSIAESQDTAAARPAFSDFPQPGLSTTTPWGVGAFFLSGGSRGAVMWNSSREIGLEFAATAATSRSLTLSGDLGVFHSRVRAFQRALAFLPVGDSVPPATIATLSPTGVTAGARAEVRGTSGTLITRVRVDGLAPGSTAANGLRVSASPSIEGAIPLAGGSISLGLGLLNQFPDLQFLADLAYDDSLVPGRFRPGNADLRYETATFAVLSYRTHVWQDGVVQTSVYKRRFGDLIASTPAASPDSSVFANRDHLDVTGGEVVIDKGLGSRSRISAMYGVDFASFGGVNGLWITGGSGSVHDEVISRLILAGRAPLPAAFDGAGQLYLGSVPPFSQVPDAQRKTEITLDLRVGRELKVGRANARLYVDVRNLLGTKPVIAVVRTTGTPGLDAATIDSLAEAAYAANPGPIGYESARYRAFADLDSNGLIEGSGELLPLYRSAAADYGEPLRTYGPPRTLRLGIEVGL